MCDQKGSEKPVIRAFASRLNFLLLAFFEIVIPLTLSLLATIVSSDSFYKQFGQ